MDQPSAEDHATDPLDAALALHREGRMEEAETAYRAILRQSPERPEAMHLLGVLYGEMGRFDEALRLLADAIARRPGDAIYYSNLGETWRRCGRLQEARECLQMALHLNPKHADSHNNLGLVWQQLGRMEEAADCYQAAIDADPGHINAHGNLGYIRTRQERLSEAVAAYKRALELQPDNAGVYNNLGSVLLRLGRVEQAVACFRRAVELDGGMVMAMANLATALDRLGRTDKALQLFDSLLRRHPDQAGYHVGRAPLLLKQGDFAEGWRELEWRLRTPGWSRQAYAHEYQKPRWAGDDLHGRRLLVYGERGLGDFLQFVRYLPLVKQRGARVLCECPPPLMRLLSGFEGIDRLLEHDPHRPVPESDFDLHAALMSLPCLFATRAENIPAAVPYIHADPALEQQWASRLADVQGRRVGLVWAGDKSHPRDSDRSCRLADLAPLAAVEGVGFISLQTGEAGEQARQAPEGMSLLHLGDHLEDFADTAAVISQLDLLVTVDTAVAHLAGAMGRPVALLLPQVADWRWQQERSDSPWYPSMRLFRQRQRGDWAELVQRVAESLRQWNTPNFAPGRRN